MSSEGALLPPKRGTKCKEALNFCSNLGRKLPPPGPRPRGVSLKHEHKSNGASLWWVVQRCLGLAAPLSVAVIGGVVGGPHAPSSLLLGGLTMLMGSLYFCELVTSQSYGDRDSVLQAASESMYRAVYRLLGELPAVIVAIYHLMSLGSLVAACAVALCGTMNFLTGDRLNKSILALLGSGGALETPIDPVAAAAPFLTSLLLALGLEQAWFLRLVMNGSSLIVLVLFVTVGAAHVPPLEERPRVHEPTLNDVVLSAGLLSTLFVGVFDIARLSKAPRPNHPSPSLTSRRPLRRLVPLGSALLVAGIIISTFPLQLVLTLITGGGDDAYSEMPLLDALKLVHVDWLLILLGSLQVIMLCLSLVQGLDAVMAQLKELSEDGLLPRFLSRECGCSHARSGAALLSGLLCALPALLLTLKALLKMSATGTLLVNTCMVLFTMYRRHRCAYASLLSSTTNTVLVGPEAYSVPNSRPLASLRNGLQTLTASLARDTHFSSGDATLSPDSDCTALMEILPYGGPFDSPRHDPGSLGSTCSGYESESDNSIDDVDVAVAWYKERVKVTSAGNTVIKSPPTPQTARRALLILFCMIILLQVLAGLVLLPLVLTTATLIISLCLFALYVLLLVVLSRLPVLSTVPSLSFSVPGHPWVSGLVLLVTVSLLLQIGGVLHMMPLFAYFLCAGMTYCCYSYRSSNLTKRNIAPSENLSSVTSTSRSLRVLDRERTAYDFESVVLDTDIGNDDKFSFRSLSEREQIGSNCILKLDQVSDIKEAAITEANVSEHHRLPDEVLEQRILQEDVVVIS